MVSKQTVTKIGSIVLLVGAGVALFLAESSYWINHTVFNQTNFTDITVRELQKESSRSAIAAGVVDETLADKPLTRRAVGDRAEALISGLLASSAGDQVMRSIANRAYAYTTSSDREDIVIDLTSIHTSLNTLIVLAQNLDGGGDKLTTLDARISTEVTLVHSDTFPDVSPIVRTMLWTGPLLWLAMVGCFAGYIYIGRKHYAKHTYIALAVAAGVSLLGLVVMPFIPSSLAVALPTIELRPVAENLAAGFLQPFRDQMVILFVIVSALALIFSQRRSIVRAVHAVAGKLAK